MAGLVVAPPLVVSAAFYLNRRSRHLPSFLFYVVCTSELLKVARHYLDVIAEFDLISSVYMLHFTDVMLALRSEA